MGLTSAQQLLHIAMFTPPKNMPDFPASITLAKLGDTIKRMFDEGVLTHLSLDNEGAIVCY